MKYAIMAVLFVLTTACTQEAGNSDPAPKAQMAESSSKPVGPLTWSTPEGWIQEAPSSSMRTAQFRLPKAEGDAEDADVVIFYFRGEGGGVESNIDRWINQFMEAGREVSSAEVTSGNGLTLVSTYISGTYLYKPTPMAPTATEKAGFRMIGTIIETAAGPWFIKFTGPAATVSKWEESYKAFLEACKA